MRLLLVEDDVMVASGIKLGLTDAGYAVDWVGSGERAEDVLRNESFDAAIIDIGLPGMDGLELTRRLRRPDMPSRNMPVLILTARDATGDKVSGLDAGADDYLVKPFEFDELLARLRALLRRQHAAVTNELKLGDLVLDTKKHSASRGGKDLNLTAREFEILEYLLQNAGTVLTRQQIQDHVWDFSYEGASNMIDVYINSLRKKLDKDFPDKLVHTIRGVGYVLRQE